MAFLPYSPLFQGLLAGAGISDKKKFSEHDVRAAIPKLNTPEFNKYFEVVELNRLANEIGSF